MFLNKGLLGSSFRTEHECCFFFSFMPSFQLSDDALWCSFNVQLLQLCAWSHVHLISLSLYPSHVYLSVRFNATYTWISAYRFSINIKINHNKIGNTHKWNHPSPLIVVVVFVVVNALRKSKRAEKANWLGCLMNL